MSISRDDVLSHLANSISHIIHDYNNLIGVIDGNASLILDKLGNDDFKEIKTDIKDILNALNKHQQIRAKLSLFYRSSYDKLEKIDIKDLINEIIKNYKDKIKIEYKCSDNIFLVRSKKDEFVILLKELLNNTLLHSKKQDVDVKINLYIDKDKICFEYLDNGCGIDKEIIDKIFFPFFTTIKDNTHIGNGLSYVWGITRRSGGKVMVDSVKDSYVKFLFTFPLITD